MTGGATRGRSRRPRPRSAGRRQAHPGPRRGPRPGRGAASARDRARRRPRPAADRPARVGQDAAREHRPGPPAAARRRRRAVGHDRGVGRRGGADDRPRPPAAVPQPAPHAVVRGDGRRRAAAVARRDHAGGPRRAVPRRAAGVRPRRPRGAPPAAGGGARGDRPGRPRGDVPGPVPADRRDEPVPVRLLRVRSVGAAVPDRCRRALRSGRSPVRCATGSTCGSTMPRVSPAAIVGASGLRGLGRRRRPDRRGAGARGTRVAPADAMRVNGRLTGRALRAACRSERRRGTPCRATGRARARPAAAGPSACCGSPGRSPTSPAMRVVAETHLDEAAWYRAPAARACRDPGTLTCSGSARTGRSRRRRPGLPSPTRTDAADRAAERDAWAVLAAAHGLGPVGFAALLRRLGIGSRRSSRVAGSAGGASALVAASAEAGAGRQPRPPDLSPERRRGDRPRPPRTPTRTLARIRALGLRVVTVEEPGLPDRGSPRSTCRRTSCSCTGDPARPRRRAAVAVVGTRRATNAGRAIAVADRDGAWSRPARASSPGWRSGSTARPTRRPSDAGGTTVAVIGGGHGHARIRGRTPGWPRRSSAGGGAVVSELAPDVAPSRGHVPAAQPDHQRPRRRDGRRRGAGAERRADHGVVGARAGPRLLPRPGPDRRPGVGRLPRVPARVPEERPHRRRRPAAHRGPRARHAGRAAAGATLLAGGDAARAGRPAGRDRRASCWPAGRRSTSSSRSRTCRSRPSWRP